MRSLARQKVKERLDAFKAAQPTRLRQTHSARPANFGAFPCAYVGPIREPRLQASSGVGQRDLEIDVVLVDELTDNEEAMTRLDEVADLLIADFADIGQAHLIHPGSVQEPRRVAGLELEIGGVFYLAVVITLLAQIQEGRQ